MTFKALLIEKDDAGYRAGVKDVDDGVLGAGEVTVRVAYSTINYKDGLASPASSPVVRKFPLVAGIDFAGTSRPATTPASSPATGAAERLGRGRKPFSGGLAQRARVKADWLLPLPAAERRARPWPSAPPATPPCCA
jgi:acrylyl-CoA reductase (NADPH)